MNLTNTWMNDPNFLAQSAHFFGAISVVMMAAHFLGKKGAFITAGIFVALALVKEYWYDLQFELPKQTIGDSSLDFLFYMIGLAFASSVLLLTKSKE